MEIKGTPAVVGFLVLLAVIVGLIMQISRARLEIEGESQEQLDGSAHKELESLRKREGTYLQTIKELETTVAELSKFAETASSTVEDRPILPARNRNELAKRIQEQGASFKIGVELGVQKALYSEVMLSTWTNCQKYILVDLWGHLENYHDLANVGNPEQEQIYNEAKNRLARWNDKTEWLRMLTSDAAKKFRNEHTNQTSGEVIPFLDFIYVDARHDYCGVKEDMENFFPFLKNGGIMAGHDYYEASEVPGQDWSICGDGSRNPGAVKGAVEGFAMKYGVQPIVVYTETYPSWIFRKPSNWKDKTTRVYRT